MVVSVFKKVSHAVIPHAFHVKRVHTVVRADYVFELVSFYEFQLIKMHSWFEHTLTALVFSDKLNEFVCYVLEIRVGLFAQ
jgi:hypothetical protein